MTDDFEIGLRTLRSARDDMAVSMWTRAGRRDHRYFDTDEFMKFAVEFRQVFHGRGKGRTFMQNVMALFDPDQQDQHMRDFIRLADATRVVMALTKT